MRDQIHCRDIAALFLHFFHHPRAGEVYNLGGGRKNNLSILETAALLSNMGYPLRTEYQDQARRGDHICYISDLAKIHAHFPHWTMGYDVTKIMNEIVEHRLRHRGA